MDSTSIRKARIGGGTFPVAIECYPCFLRQVVIALELAGADAALREAVISAALEDLRQAWGAKSPAHATSIMHRTIRRLVGRDPYREVKRTYTDRAMGMYPHLRRLADDAPDPLFTASRLAIAGNVIDFGISSTIDVEGTVERALSGPIAVDDYAAFREALGAGGRVLYLLDNAGESVFDRILIETLAATGHCVTAVAKGGPVINDCTIEDARRARIHEACELIDNGSDAVGTVLEDTSLGFRALYDDPGMLVISKGQGNFETLIGERRGIFFLFQAKCDVLAAALGLERGAMLLLEGA